MRSYYIGGMIIFNFAALTLYSVSANYLKPENTFAKIIIFFNLFFVEFVIFFKRIIRKDENYKLAIRNNNHGKYSKKDIILVLIIAIEIVSIGKLCDVNPSAFLREKYDTLIGVCF